MKIDWIENTVLFPRNGMLNVAHRIDYRTLERLFRHHVLQMLLEKGKITRDVIASLDRWRHTGIKIYCGE